MRRLIDNLICVTITLGMFAFPLLLLGFAPWLGDSLMGGLGVHVGRSALSHIVIVVLMLTSAGLALALAMPAFALMYWPMARLSALGTRLVSVYDAPLREALADETVPAVVRSRVRPSPAGRVRPAQALKGLRARSQ